MLNSRKEFERNMYFLREGFEKNRVRFNQSNVKSLQGLRNVRLSPNNRANLNSADEGARALANSFSMMFTNKVLPDQYGEK